jgi:hypothetical protein
MRSHRRAKGGYAKRSSESGSPELEDEKDQITRMDMESNMLELGDNKDWGYSVDGVINGKI